MFQNPKNRVFKESGSHKKMSTVFDQLNDLLSFSHTFFAEVLRKVQFHPSYYAFLFPPVVTRETVYQLIDDKVFPILPDLAPAFTYAIILSLLRFVLQYSVVKVVIFYHNLKYRY